MWLSGKHVRDQTEPKAHIRLNEAISPLSSGNLKVVQKKKSPRHPPRHHSKSGQRAARVMPLFFISSLWGRSKTINRWKGRSKYFGSFHLNIHFIHDHVLYNYIFFSLAQLRKCQLKHSKDHFIYIHYWCVLLYAQRSVYYFIYFSWALNVDISHLRNPCLK